MALMEKIIRPHLPANIAPTPAPPKCQVPGENTIAKFSQASRTRPNISVSSSWSYSHKKYADKKEKEKEDKTAGDKGPGTTDDPRNISGGHVTEKEVPRELTEAPDASVEGVVH